MSTRRAGTTRCPARSGGFTLLEVLLVLGILVLLAAVAWPSFRGPLAAARLREGARSVCNEIARARLRAIETGNILVLRYESGGRRYEIVTRMVALEGDEATRSVENQASQDVAGLATGSRAWPAGKFVPVQGELPPGVHFIRTADFDAAPLLTGNSFSEGEGAVAVDSTNVDDTSDDSLVDSLSTGPIGAGAAGVYLYPDGTARDATIRLANDQGTSIAITLRGLTGATSLGTVVESEVTP